IGYCPGPAEPDPADLRDADLAPVPVQTAYVGRLDGHDPETLIAPGLAPARPAVRPGEEVPHCLREVPQRLLLHYLGAVPQPGVPGAGGGDLLALLQVARRAVPARPPVRVLFRREVPHVPGVRTVPQQYRFLLRSGDQPVPGHTNTIS